VSLSVSFCDFLSLCVCAFYSHSFMFLSLSVSMHSDIGTPGGSGAASVASSISDTGAGITAYECQDTADDGDSDNDGICNEWEFGYTGGAQAEDGILFTIDGAEHFLELAGTSEGTRDMIIEIDSMGTVHTPDPISRGFVEGNMTEQGVNVIHVISDEDIPHDGDNLEIEVWTDFNTIKSEHFGNDDEKITISPSTSQSNAVFTQPAMITFDSDVTDSSGFNPANDGTVTGTETLVAGKVGNAFSFDGGTFVTLANEANFDFDTGDSRSYAFWIKTALGGGARILSINGDSASPFTGDWIKLVSGKIRVQILGTSLDFIDVRSAAVVSNNEWHHVAVTYDGGSASGVKIYIDGALDSSTIIRDLLASSTLNNFELTLGGLTTGTNFFTGQMDEYRVYSFELSLDQVTGLFNQAVPLPITHHKFESVTGSTLSDSLLPPDSEAANDGTVTGTATLVASDDGNAFSFDGGTFVTFAHENEFDFDIDTGDPRTYAFWIKTSQGTGARILAIKADPTTPFTGDWIKLVSGKIRLQILGTSLDYIDVRSAGVVSDNLLHHVAVTFDGTSSASGVKIYIDGALDSSTIVRDTLASSTLNNVPLVLGALTTGSNFFTGQLDEFRVYDFELSNDQVSELADRSTDIHSLVQISGYSITTPDTVSTRSAGMVGTGVTEAVVTMKVDLTSPTGTTPTFSDDPDRAISVSGATSFAVQTNDITMSAVNPFGNNFNILRVTSNYATTGPITTAATLGTISIPLVGDAAIESVATSSGSGATSTTLLQAKAQAFRYSLYAHSIGGASGQGELRGNDMVVALGVGFEENDVTHDGTEGSPEQIQGVMMHEYGHLLNINHGGPTYLDVDQDGNFTPEERADTISTSIQNCVPINKSVMAYSYQLPSVAGELWDLNYNEKGGLTGLSYSEKYADPLTTTGPADQNEFDGIVLDGETILWSTPGQGDGKETGVADGTPLDLNGDGDGGTGGDVGSFDLNNFGLAGCLATPDEVFTIYDETLHYDFNFREGNNGQFDSGIPCMGDDCPHTKLLSERTDAMASEAELFGASFVVLPPIDEDGKENKKLGANVPFKARLFKQGASQVEIVDEQIRIDIVYVDNSGDKVRSTIGAFVFEPSTGHYHFDLSEIGDLPADIDKGETVGFVYVLLIPDAFGGTTFRDLIIDQTPRNTVAGSDGIEEEVTVLVTFK